jgi:diaminohydroxyphosphoribosylaminopyrimidine deaminase/5-amino-6-(5-phosphoribosylamino)uracil reductase
MEPKQTTADLHYMERALALAKRGWGYTAPNPMVGAVVVKDHRVIGEGWHKAAGAPHAEVNALAAAGESARGADLYVTLEPCRHTGRTPPCTQAVLEAGIKRVVFAAADPAADAGGGGAVLEAHGLQVEGGIREAEAKALNRPFFHRVQANRAFVTLKTAATLDGRIATRNGDSRWVTSEHARNHVHRLRQRVDAVMTGVGTVAADNPRLTVRHPDFSPPAHPRRVVLDTRLSVSPEATIFDGTAQVLVICGQNIAGNDFEDRRRRLEDRGATILPVPVTGGRVDIAAAVNRLYEAGIYDILIEGGSRTAHSALRARVVTHVNFFYAPKILGGDDGVPLLRGEGLLYMRDAITLTDVTVERFGDDILVGGDPVWPVQ